MANDVPDYLSRSFSIGAKTLEEKLASTQRAMTTARSALVGVHANADTIYERENSRLSIEEEAEKREAIRAVERKYAGLRGDNEQRRTTNKVTGQTAYVESTASSLVDYLRTEIGSDIGYALKAIKKDARHSMQNAHHQNAFYTNLTDVMIQICKDATKTERTISEVDGIIPKEFQVVEDLLNKREALDEHPLVMALGRKSLGIGGKPEDDAIASYVRTIAGKDVYSAAKPAANSTKPGAPEESKQTAAVAVSSRTASVPGAGPSKSI